MAANPFGALPTRVPGSQPKTLQLSASGDVTEVVESYDLLIVGYLLKSTDKNRWADVLRRGLGRPSANSLVRLVVAKVQLFLDNRGRLPQPLELIHEVPDFGRRTQFVVDQAPADLDALLEAQAPVWTKELHELAWEEHRKSISGGQEYGRAFRAYLDTVKDIERCTLNPSDAAVVGTALPAIALEHYLLDEHELGVVAPLPFLKEQLDILRYGDTTVLAAPTSTGKSWFGGRTLVTTATGIVGGVHIAGPHRIQQDIDFSMSKRAAFFSPEMQVSDLSTRQMAVQLGMSHQDIRYRKLCPEQVTLLRQYSELATLVSGWVQADGVPLEQAHDQLLRVLGNGAHDDLRRYGVNAKALVATSNIYLIGPDRMEDLVDVFRIADDLELDLAIIDSFYLLVSPGREGMQEALGDAVKRIVREAASAKRHHMIVAQINREGASAERPELRHLSDTSALEKHPSNVVFLKETGRSDVSITLRITVEKARGDAKSGEAFYQSSLLDMTMTESAENSIGGPLALIPTNEAQPGLSLSRMIASGGQGFGTPFGR